MNGREPAKMPRSVEIDPYDLNAIDKHGLGDYVLTFPSSVTNYYIAKEIKANFNIDVSEQIVKRYRANPRHKKLGDVILAREQIKADNLKILVEVRDEFSKIFKKVGVFIETNGGKQEIDVAALTSKIKLGTALTEQCKEIYDQADKELKLDLSRLEAINKTYQQVSNSNPQLGDGLDAVVDLSKSPELSKIEQYRRELQYGKAK